LANVRAQRERYASVVSDIIARGVRAGEFAVPDVGIATLGLLGMCNWLCQWYSPTGRLSASDIGARFADLVLDGLRGPQRKKRGGASRCARAAISWRRERARRSSRRLSG